MRVDKSTDGISYEIKNFDTIKVSILLKIKTTKSNTHRFQQQLKSIALCRI